MDYVVRVLLFRLQCYYLLDMIELVKILHPTRHKTGHLGDMIEEIGDNFLQP